MAYFRRSIQEYKWSVRIIKFLYGYSMRVDRVHHTCALHTAQEWLIGNQRNLRPYRTHNADVFKCLSSLNVAREAAYQSDGQQVCVGEEWTHKKSTWPVMFYHLVRWY